MTTTAEIIQKIKSIDFPILDIFNRKGSTSYIDFIKEKELGQHSVIKGVDCIGRFFITIKAEYLLPTGELVPSFSTFFQRYSDDYNTWQCCGHDGTLLFATEGGMRHEQFEILYQLLTDSKVDLNSDLIRKIRLIVLHDDDSENKEDNIPLQIRLREKEKRKSYSNNSFYDDDE